MLVQAFVRVQKSRDGFGSKRLERTARSAREVLNLRRHGSVFRNSLELEKMRLESSEGCQRCRRDRLVELAAAGETGQTRLPSAAGVSWRNTG